jgi:hypothetical protein
MVAASCGISIGRNEKTEKKKEIKIKMNRGVRVTGGLGCVRHGHADGSFVSGLIQTWTKSDG